MKVSLENTHEQLEHNDIIAGTAGDTAECRVCLQELRQGSVTLPCKCKGSNSYIHEKCFLQWSSKMKRFNTKEDRYYFNCDVCASVIYLDAKKKYRCVTKEEIKTELFGTQLKCTILTISFLLLSFFLMILILAGLREEAGNQFQQLLALAASIICGVVFLIALFSYTVNFLVKEEVVNYGLAQKQTVPVMYNKQNQSRPN